MVSIWVYSKQFSQPSYFRVTHTGQCLKCLKHHFGFVFQAPLFFDYDLMISNLNMELYWYM